MGLQDEAESSDGDSDDFDRGPSIASGVLQQSGSRVKNQETPRASMQSLASQDAEMEDEEEATDTAAKDSLQLDQMSKYKRLEPPCRSVRMGNGHAFHGQDTNGGVTASGSLIPLGSPSSIPLGSRDGSQVTASSFGARSTAVGAIVPTPFVLTPREVVKRCVQNPLFDALMFLIVITNAATIGIAVNFMAQSAAAGQRRDLPIIFEKFETFFCVVFTSELCLRFYIFEPDRALGRIRLYSFERKLCPRKYLYVLEHLRFTFFWSMANVFDMVLVVMQLVDELSKAAGYEAEEQSSIADAMVYLRLFRIFRLMRIVRFLEQLSNLLYLVFASLWAFIWTLLLLVVLTYMTGTFFTHVVAEHVINHPEHGDELRPAFGSLGTSAYSLYEAIMGGIDWHEVADPLWHVSTAMPLIFGVYVAFSVLVLLNLVTGVFVDTAQRMRQDDRKRELDRGLKSAADMAGITMDEDVPDSMFRELLKKPGMRSFLKMHDVDKSTVRKVFGLLRERNHGTLSLNDFVTFCLRLNGLGNAIELAGLHLTGAKDRTQLMHLHQRGERDRAYLRKLTEHGIGDNDDLKKLHLQGVAERKQLQDTLWLIHRRLGADARQVTPPSPRKGGAAAAAPDFPGAAAEKSAPRAPPAPEELPILFSPRRSPRTLPEAVEVVASTDTAFEVEEAPLSLQAPMMSCISCRANGGSLY